MTTLQTVSGIAARIFQLPNRPPFMVTADLAEAYDRQPFHIIQAVKRNATRFPEDFAFRLTETEAAELQGRLSQNGMTSPGQRTDLRPLVFTHAGAIALSGVLKTEVAAEVSVIVHRAYAAMEERAYQQVAHLLQRVQSEARGRRPIRSRIVDAAREGWSFDQLWRDTSLSRVALAQAVFDCLALALIDTPLAGTPYFQFKANPKMSDTSAAPGQQPDLFSE